MKWQDIIRLYITLISLFLFMSCDSLSETDRAELQQLAKKINSLFLQARSEIEGLKIITHNLLDHPEKAKGLYHDKRYKFTKEYAYYTPEDDGYCEVWGSGHIPVGKSERRRIKMFEHFCPDLERIYKRNDFIDYVYLTTYDSIVIGYPYTDIQAYMKPGLDLTKVWVTYWTAAEKANPDRRTVWVGPYIDAIGRGYMTSIITPVYKNDFLEGTLGIDITVDLISDKFISLSGKNLLIVTRRTIPVATNKNSYNILKIKGLEKYNYLKKEAENKAISTSLMMTKSHDEDIRKIAFWVQSSEKSAVLSISKKPYDFFKEKIPEVEWFLIEFK